MTLRSPHPVGFAVRYLRTAFLLVGLGFLLSGTVLRAQVLLRVGAAVSPTAPIRNEPFLLTLSVTNYNTVYQSAVVLTNVLDPAVTLQGVRTNASILSWTNNAGSVEFRLRDLDVGQFHTLVLTGLVSRVGPFTNRVDVASVDIPVLSSTAVFEVVNRQSDLQVGIAFDEAEPLTGQNLSYRVVVTNLGPERIESLVVSNALPSVFEFRAASGPSTTAPVPTNGVLRLEVPGLDAGSGTAFTVSVTTATSGAAALVATILPHENTDPVSANDSASSAFRVLRVVDGDVSVLPVDDGVFSAQTGLVRHRFRVENSGTNAVPGVRIFVSGPVGAPSNLGGTNLGRAFLQWPGTIPSGGSTDFVLEYFSATRQPLRTAQLGFEPVPVTVEEDAPSATSSVASVLPRTTSLGWLLEFPTVPGKRYRIVYGDTAEAATSRTARPVLTARGTRTQWFDYGPPVTAPLPAAGAASRFYRVQEVAP